MFIGYLSLLIHWQIFESKTSLPATQSSASSVGSLPTGSPAPDPSLSSEKTTATDTLDTRPASDAVPNSPATPAPEPAPSPHPELLALPTRVRRLLLQVAQSAVLLLLLLLLLHQTALRFVSAPIARSVISALVLLMFGAHVVLALAFKWRQLRARLSADRSCLSASATPNCSSALDSTDHTDEKDEERILDVYIARSLLVQLLGFSFSPFLLSCLLSVLHVDFQCSQVIL